ncbi:MAG: hypothetical protein PHV20_12290 [Bacteroidales bacterium]|nr:hypothetical protein [Bacteroidales bacterium]
MTDRYLIRLIKKLNSSNSNELIHLRPLSKHVDFAKVWIEKPKTTDNISYPDCAYKFYFIKNKEGLYVATVLDMNTDLHWLVLKEYRGNGYLTNALRETILPHLFQDRNEQIITINEYHSGSRNYISSEKVAINLGFVKSEGKESKRKYLLSNENYKSIPYNYGVNTEITEERLNVLIKRINHLSRSLWVIQTEVQMKLGDSDYSEELFELVKEIRKHTYRLEDAWWDNKRKMID